MSAHLTEEEQIESIKQWWGQYGRAIIIGVIVGILVLWGWQTWQSHRHNHAQSASMHYYTLLRSAEAGDEEAMANEAMQLMNDYPNTTYTTFAAFLLAKYAVDTDALEDAETQLRWVMANSRDHFLVDVATTRLARVLLADAQPDAALVVLDNINLASPYAAIMLEAKGDIYVALNEFEEASVTYQAALDAANTVRELGEAQNVQILQFKINDLKVNTDDESIVKENTTS